jgi:uncharacterized protein (DUF1800 family)
MTIGSIIARRSANSVSAHTRSKFDASPSESRLNRSMAALLPLALVSLAAPLTQASAQAANCPLDVSRDVVTIPTPRAPTVALDGLLLTRFAVGLRGPALYDNVSKETNRFVAEGNTGTTLAQLDVDGDGVFTSTDATVLSRYIAGFRDAALTNGLTFSSGASRGNTGAIVAHINGGCVASAAVADAKRHAARLLQQGTYGATLGEINRVSGLGGGDPTAMTQAWLNEQFAAGRSIYANYAQQLADQNKTPAYDWRCNPSDTFQKTSGCLYGVNTPSFYRFAMEGSDQLRQRVTNALWQTLVVSIANNTILDAGVGLPDYLDMISNNLFAGNTTNAAGQPAGNFRKTLKDMTLHPAMGIYLDMLGSTQEVPNENYARELLQLFSVGTVMLNQDGSVKRDASNKPIPSYNEDVVKGFAKALTGWHFANQDVTQWWKFYYPDRNWRAPMTPWNGRRCPQDGKWPAGSTTNCDINDPARSFPPPHNTSTKMLLQYSAPSGVKNNLPAGQTIQRDLEDTIDNVFYHPNVGPFISRQLIQRLVTSNPTPGYISRVAGKFNDNGSGIRGDMRAVVTQIFLDPEARDVNIANKNYFGKLREPVNKFVHLHRAFGARETSEGFYEIWTTDGPDTLGQAAMRPPSVFNYYSPDFGPSGPLAYSAVRPIDAAFGSRAAEPMLGPEFEITSTSTVAGFGDFFNWGVFGGFTRDFGGGKTFKWQPDYSRYITGAGALAENPQALVDELDLLLTAGNLKPAFKAQLVDTVSKIFRSLPPNYTQPDDDGRRRDRLREAMWQIVNSADYAIQR